MTQREYAAWELTGDPAVPAIVRVNGRQTPVWIQQRWEEGEFSRYIRNNGCGHCCTAMAARLYGADIDPYREYLHCRSLWGAPDKREDGSGQDHFLSLGGILRVLHSLGVPAGGFGVLGQGEPSAVAHICRALRGGRQVIFTSTPDNFPDNPFSRGYHWVLAVGFAADGRILVANSSEKLTPQGVQLVTPQVIGRALFPRSTAGTDMTWGELARLDHGCGYVVVG